MVDSKIMNEIINILETNNYKYYCKVVYKNGEFYEAPNYFKFNCLKVQLKKDYEKVVLKWFDNVSMTEINRNKYWTAFNLDNNCYLIMEYVIDSHIIIPNLILKDFKSIDTKVYYIDPKIKKINSGSARKFNTEFGYYSLMFEDFLNKNYETNIGKIKKKIEDSFLKDSSLDKCIIPLDDIQKFLDCSLIRNPQFVFNVNQESLSSKLIYKGYNTEFLMMVQHKSMDHLFKNFVIYLLINKTDEGLVLSSEIFSNIFIKDSIAGIIVPLHPKYGIVIVPSNGGLPYSNDHFMVIEDVNILHQINRRIYLDCKKSGINVVGIKEDLMQLV